MLNYIKYLLGDDNDKETPFEKNFFISNIEHNRKIFCSITNSVYNESNEIEIEKIIKRKIDEDDFIEKTNKLIGDRSYNMCDNYNLKQLIHFEYLSLFLKRNTIKNSTKKKEDN
jgi:hypothetical protein